MRAPRWPNLTQWIVMVTAMSPATSTASHDRMIVIPSATMLLGSTMDEIVVAAAECARDHLHAAADHPCSPDNFVHELSGPHPTVVPRFKIDRTEVSVGEYDQCVRAGRCQVIEDPRRIEAFRVPTVPAVFVTKGDAAAYCKWRDARLPTEAEFELAARGPGRRQFPWGHLVHHGRANAGRPGARITDDRDGYELLAPIESFPDGRSPQGTLNLSGNAAEWTSTRYGRHSEPEGDRSDQMFVVKGGSFSVGPIHLRSAARRATPPSYRGPDTGFRCAQTINIQSTPPQVSNSR